MSALESPLSFESRFVNLTVGDRFGETFVSATEFKLSQVATKLAPGCHNYLLAYKPNKFSRPDNLDLKCVLHEHAVGDDILRAFFHGLVVDYAFNLDENAKPHKGALGTLQLNALDLRNKEEQHGRGWGQVMKSSAEYCESNFKNFTEVCVAAGWNLDRLLVSVGQFRCQWSELIEIVD